MKVPLSPRLFVLSWRWSILPCCLSCFVSTQSLSRRSSLLASAFAPKPQSIRFLHDTSFKQQIISVTLSSSASKSMADDPESTSTKRKRTAKAAKEVTVTDKKAATSIQKETTTTANAANKSDTDESPNKAKAKKPPSHQVLTERDILPKLWTPLEREGSYTLKMASWNVAGLRAVLRNNPDALVDLVMKHDLDVLCLQETKLQEMHLDDPKLKLRGHLLEEQGYNAYYSCCTVKKGYSGTAVFIKRRNNNGNNTTKKQKTLDSFFVAKKGSDKGGKLGDTTNGMEHLLIPESVSFEMGVAKHDGEGRIIVVDFPHFSFCNVYVPNSGQNLNRLQYRTDEWDKDLLAFIQRRQKDRGVPCLWLGDLNVAHTNLEVWNDGAKHLSKQAGVTPEERASFQQMLDAGFVDAFRKLHPTAKGHYSYWSQRAGNREPNKGLRLDYFICGPEFFKESSNVVARDSYMIFDQEGSDHCPVVLELEIKI